MELGDLAKAHYKAVKLLFSAIKQPAFSNQRRFQLFACEPNFKHGAP